MPPDLDSLVSPYVGVVRGVDEVLAQPSDIRLTNILCETGFVEPLVGHGTKHAGSGSATSRAAARAAAIGEAVERYSACWSDDADAVVATAVELGNRAVEPRRFALFSDRQHRSLGFPYARFTEHTRVAWVPATSLPEREPALVPAQLVYLGWTLRPGEERIAHATSNGLACQVTSAAATFTALLELIERDAFMITWNARLSLPLLEWPHNLRLTAFERRFVRPTGLRVSAVDLSAFWGVPCVLGVARSAIAGDAPFGVGAGAAATIERAVEKALDEAIRVRSWASALRASGRIPAREAIREFDDHIQYYAYEEHAAAADFLDASEERREIASVAPVEGIESITQRGVRAYAVDVTAPDVRAAGLRVVKVVAPELCALDVVHAFRFLGGRRLYDEPMRLGMRARPLLESEINPEPHPFP
jgi:ribosomal protein S12 methylthiotransferase accessory factor